jgi:hypothetical protein
LTHWSNELPQQLLQYIRDQVQQCTEEPAPLLHPLSGSQTGLTSKKSSNWLSTYCGGLLMLSHILCTSSARISASLDIGVLLLSRMTNSSTVRRLLGSGANSFRFT